MSRLPWLVPCCMLLWHKFVESLWRAIFQNTAISPGVDVVQLVQCAMYVTFLLLRALHFFLLCSNNAWQDHSCVKIPKDMDFSVIDKDPPHIVKGFDPKQLQGTWYKVSLCFLHTKATDFQFLSSVTWSSCIWRIICCLVDAASNIAQETDIQVQCGIRLYIFRQYHGR